MARLVDRAFIGRKYDGVLFRLAFSTVVGLDHSARRVRMPAGRCMHGVGTHHFLEERRRPIDVRLGAPIAIGSYLCLCASPLYVHCRNGSAQQWILIIRLNCPDFPRRSPRPRRFNRFFPVQPMRSAMNRDADGSNQSVNQSMIITIDPDKSA